MSEEATVSEPAIEGWRISRNQVEWIGRQDTEFVRNVLVPKVVALRPDLSAVLGTAPETGMQASAGRFSLSLLPPDSTARQLWMDSRNVVAAVDRLLPLLATRAAPAQVVAVLESLRAFADDIAREGVLDGLPSPFPGKLANYVAGLETAAKELMQKTAGDASVPWGNHWEQISSHGGNCIYALAPLASVSLWRVHDPDAARRAVVDHGAMLAQQASAAAEHNDKLAATLREQASELEERSKQVMALQAELEKSVTRESIRRHELKFAVAEQRHRWRGYGWLVVGTVFVLGAAGLYGRWHGAGTDAEAFTPAFLLEIASRLTPIVITLSVAFWAARNYAVERHNETINAHRVDALATFEQLLKGAGDRDEERRLILTAVTNCLYTVQPTTPNARATDPGVLGLAEALAILKSKS